MGEERKPLSIKEAAEALKVHPNTLRAWVDKGMVPCTRLPSGYRRFSQEQMEEIRRAMLERRGAA